MPNRDRRPLACLVFLTVAGVVLQPRAQGRTALDEPESVAALEQAWEAAPLEDRAKELAAYRVRFERLEGSQDSSRARLWLLENQFAFEGAQEGRPEPAQLRARQLRFEALARSSRALEGPTLDRFLDLIAGERWIARRDLLALGSELVARDTRPELAGGTLVALAANLAPPSGASTGDRRQARTYLDQVIHRWPRSAAATRARALRWRIDNLSVGVKAPGFLGFDAKGNELRLAHFLGRVVVLQVWSFEKPETVRRMRAGERLRDQLWDAPFTWLGLNTDPDADAFRQACEDRDIDWKQHLWEGGERRPATQAWRLDGEPLLVLLDGDGVVRGIDLEPERLEERIASLLTALREKIPSRDTRPEEPAREGD